MLEWSGAAAARILDVAYSNVDQWDRVGVARPSVRASGPGSRRRYSFQDLLGLAVAAEVLRIGVPRGVAKKLVALVVERRGLDTEAGALRSSGIWIACDGTTAWELREGQPFRRPRASKSPALYAVPLRPIVEKLCSRLADPRKAPRRKRRAST